MSVYVDDMRAGFGRMVMCHCVADTREELLATMDAVGVAKKWIQKAGTPSEHFDICLSKRAAAVRAGAKEISQRELHAVIQAKRGAAALGGRL